MTTMRSSQQFCAVTAYQVHFVQFVQSISNKLVFNLENWGFLHEHIVSVDFDRFMYKIYIISIELELQLEILVTESIGLA